MQSQIETTVTNGSPNSSKESSLRPLTPENTKENGINHITNGSTNGSNGSDSDHNQTATSSPKPQNNGRSEEHTSEPSHDQISYAVFCLKKKKNTS